MASKTREEIIAEVQASSVQRVSDWYFDRDTGKFYNSEGEDLGFAFFPRKSMFQTTEGIIIELRGVNNQTVGNFSAAYDKKYAPKMPIKRIKIDEGEYYSEGNPSDAGYVSELKRYSENKEITVAAYLISLAVKNKLPNRTEWDESFHFQIEALQELASEPLKDYVIRYEWVMSLLKTNTEMIVFVQIVMGADLPTTEALRQAEARFQDTVQP